MPVQRVSVFGLGHVGLCTASVFAQKGFRTIGVDIDNEKINQIKAGKPPFFEPDLDAAVKKALALGTLHLTTEPFKAMEESDISFITVGTPSQQDGQIDFQYVRSAVKDIGKALQEKSYYHLIVIKSTVSPGTTKRMIKPLLEEYSQKVCGPDFGLCSNPEFIREGEAIQDILHPDRIIIGEYDLRSGNALEDLYKNFHGPETPKILRTNLTNAEFIKYASNAFLATKISFINTVANICEETPEADVTVVAEGIGLDHRISPHFLRAGLGYGGSCLPKDLRALIAYSRKTGYYPELLEAVEQVNEHQPLKAVEMAEKLIGNLDNKRIAILGLAFKPLTDDIREAVSVKIINKLLEKGVDISAYDPAAKENVKKILGNKIKYSSSMFDCLKDVDCLILVTEWEEFKKLTPEHLLKQMKNPAIVDGRRITDPNKFKKKVKFKAIGLGHI